MTGLGSADDTHFGKTDLDSEQENKIYILVVLGFGPVFGQSWAQKRAKRPRLEKCNTNQRKLAREIDSKTPRKLEYKILP